MGPHMNERLETLFSPERLRKRWENKEHPQALEIKNVKLKTTNDIEPVFKMIHDEILKEYDGEKKEVLEIMLADIKKGIDRFAAGNHNEGNHAGEGFAVIDQIHQLEDLLDAF